MNSQSQAFLIPFGLWTLLGTVLVVRVFITTLRAGGSGDPAAQAKDLQKQFTRVAILWMAALPLAIGAYYLLRA